MTYDPLQIGEILAGVYTAKTHTPKQNLLIDTNKHSPILRFDEDITGLLKPRDRAAVQHVVQALNDRCLRVYLGGSTVENALLGKPREYGDIDLLVVGEHIPVHNIKRVFNETIVQQAAGTLGSLFDYPGRKFVIHHSLGKHEDPMLERLEAYCNMSAVRRYTMIPSGKATPIDVAVTTLDMFEFQRVREL